MRHCEPSHRSASGCGPPVFANDPTARHAVSLTHATSFSALCEDLPANGDSDQLEPFHCSTIAESPTAKHRLVLVHAMSTSSAKGVEGGTVGSDQFDPSQWTLTGLRFAF